MRPDSPIARPRRSPDGRGSSARLGALVVFLGLGAAVAAPAAHAEDNESPSRDAATSSAPSRDAATGSAPSRDAATGSAPSRDAATSSAPSRDAATSSAAQSGAKPGQRAPRAPAAAAQRHRSPVRATAAARDRGPGAEPDLPAAEVRAAAAAPAQAAPRAALRGAAIGNQVSPLGTPVQLERERVAMRTAASLPVSLMKIALRQGFLAAAEEQFALVGGPDAANLAALDNAVDEFALAAAFSQQILNPMDPAVVTQVAPPHSWYGLDVGGSRQLYDNPDTVYRFVPVNKTSEYVLTGRIYEGIPADTTFSVLEGTSGTTSTVLSLRDLEVSEDGSFVITASGKPAAPGQANHLQLTSSSTLIAARNTLGNWDIEEPMELEVHRVSGPRNSLFAQLGGFVLLGSLVNDRPVLAKLLSVIPPLRIAEAPFVRGVLTALLLGVRGANQQARYMALATTDPGTGALRPPNVMTQPASNAEFLANQLQSNGYFQLADDEALVLTIDPAGAGFFTVPVYNVWTITGDYWNQQTSLNNDQAVANPDGTYTMVVSTADPAVANWVSTGGLRQGIISMRFQDIDPDAAAAPSVQSAVVKLADLGEILPAGTAFVTPGERAVQLAARKAGFDKRWAPYPQA